MPLHLDTPLFQSRRLSLLAGKSIWLKFEALQPSGSFKLRGIGAACEEYKRQGKSRFISSSGGNAGLAVAYAGRLLDIPVTVVVPQSTPLNARNLLEQEGAAVIVHGAVWAEANALAQSLLDDTTAFLHPFDNPLLWSGHATLIDEVVRSGAQFDGVILSVGGGGLLSGVAEGMERNGLANLPIIAVETEGADCLARALAAGQNIPMAAITSVATSLGANKTCFRARPQPRRAQGRRFRPRGAQCLRAVPARPSRARGAGLRCVLGRRLWPAAPPSTGWHQVSLGRGVRRGDGDTGND